MATKFDSRQTTNRDVLQQIIPNLTEQQLDALLKSIDSDLTPPLRVEAANPASHVVTIGAAIIQNIVSGRNKSINFINNLMPNFTSGTVTFPTLGSGNITTSTGGSFPLGLSSNQYVKVLLALDSIGNLQVTVGTPAASSSLAAIPSPIQRTLPFAYVSVFNNAGTVANIAQTDLFQLVGGGGAGGGSGTGIGNADLNSLQYDGGFSDILDTPPSDITSSIDTSVGLTNATYVVSGSGSAYQVSYDASKLLSGSGVNVTLSAAPSFTVKVGDMVIFGSQARRITVVNTQSSYTIESAFASNPSSSACCVSQAVYTKDLNNFAGDGVSLATNYPGTINDCLVTYNDTASGLLYNNIDPPLVAYTASSDGTNFTNVAARKAALLTELPITGLPTAGTNFYLRFFANTTSGNGTVIFGGYDSYFHRDPAVAVGGVLNQAICFTNGVGTPVGCSNPTVVSTKTTVALTWSYPANINPGKANGALSVTLNGVKIPRFINSTLTPDASYVEVDANTISLDRDYSGLNYSLEIIEDVAIIDNSPYNANQIQSIMNVLVPVGSVQASMLSEVQFQAQTSSSWVLADGRNVAGSLYATITGNTTIPDLRGVFLRGKNNGRADGKENPDGDSALGTYQADELASHSHFNNRETSATRDTDDADISNTVTANGGSGWNTNATGGNETRAKNVTINWFMRIN